MILEVFLSLDFFRLYASAIDNFWWLIAPLVFYAAFDQVAKRYKFETSVNRLPTAPRRSYLLGNVDMALGGVKQGCDAGESILQALSGFSFQPPFRKAGLSCIWVGPLPVVALFSPETAEALLSSNKLIDKAFFYDFMHSWLGLGLLTSYGEKWHRHRKMLTPSFHFRILDEFLPVMTKQTRIFVEVLEKLRASNPEGIVKDISTPILMCALDTICETAMGTTVNAQLDPDNGYVQAVHKAGLRFVERLTNPLHINRFVYMLTPQGREYEGHVKVLHNFTTAAIQGKKQEMMKNIANGTFQEKKCMAFMDTLIYQHLKDPKSLTEQEIQEEVDTFMFEGHDTTGWGITWCTYMIGLYPNVQRKVHEELDTVLGTDAGVDFTMENLRELKYLECCIKEALRLFPSVPFFGRKVHEDTVINGFTIPAGVQMGVAAFLVHRNPDHWPNPEVYDPDRFLPENCRGRHPYAFVPFSAGPRNCIGQKFALNEEKSILASMFRNFKVTSIEHRDKVRLTAAMILKSQLPMPVKLERRF